MKLWTFALFVGLACAEYACEPEGPKEEGCPVVGNSDFYGLGVRVGIYTSWLTSWLANNFLPEEIAGSLETNSIFLLALFATAFFFSVQAGQIRVIDVLIIQQLSLGFVFSVMSLWGYRTMYYRTEGEGGRRHFGGFGTHFRLFLMGMICAYGVWFWLDGVNDGLTYCNRRDDCGGLDTFFFAPMKVDGWANKVIQLIISIGAAAYYGIMIVAALVCGVVYVVRRVRGKDAHWELLAQQDSGIAMTKRELTHGYIVMSFLNLFWIVFSMLSIEFTLNLNHVSNVLGNEGLVGPGQIIPGAIGLLSLTRVVFVLIRRHWLGKEEGCCDDAPTTDTKYMGGLALTMTNTNSIYSPSTPGFGKREQGESPGKTPSTLVQSISALPPLPAIGTQRRRSYFHRFMLAWLPWLGLFDFWKKPITPELRRFSLFGSPSVEKYESVHPEQPEREPVVESPSTALLSSQPQLAPGQKGLMADMADIELSRRQSTRRDARRDSDAGAYEGIGYEDYYDHDEP